MCFDFVFAAKKIGIDVSKKELDKFILFMSLLLKENEKFNLTSITDKREIFIKHFLDSIQLLSIFDVDNKNVVDIGSGAGFPGIPIKILRPNIRMTLIESNGKKCDFLKKIIVSLKLTDVNVVCGRAEELSKTRDFREKFNLVIARAVTKLSILSELSIPFLDIDGYFIAYKSKKANDEVDESKNFISVLGGKIESVILKNIYDMIRVFVIIKKIKLTPALYPRKFSIIKKIFG